MCLDVRGQREFGIGGVEGVGSLRCMRNGLDWGSAGCVVGWSGGGRCSAMGKGSASVRAAAADEAELRSTDGS